MNADYYVYYAVVYATIVIYDNIISIVVYEASILYSAKSNIGTEHQSPLVCSCVRLKFLSIKLVIATNGGVYQYLRVHG